MRGGSTYQLCLCRMLCSWGWAFLEICMHWLGEERKSTQVNLPIEQSTCISFSQSSEATSILWALIDSLWKGAAPRWVQVGCLLLVWGFDGDAVYEAFLWVMKEKQSISPSSSFIVFLPGIRELNLSLSSNATIGRVLKLPFSILLWMSRPVRKKNALHLVRRTYIKILLVAGRHPSSFPSICIVRPLCPTKNSMAPRQANAK